MGSKRTRNQRPASVPLPTLAFLSDGNVDFLFTVSLIRWLTLAGASRRTANVIAQECGPRLARGRCDLVEKFLEGTDEWLLMVDSDMTFEPADVLSVMHAADPDTRPIVGGLCFTGGIGGDVAPTLLFRPDPAGGFHRHVDYPANALLQVDATGAAFLLVHRRVLEAMADRYPLPHRWFAESVIAGHDVGEDVTFCVRAAELGFPIFVHTGVEIGHVKRRVVNASVFRGT